MSNFADAASRGVLSAFLFALTFGFLTSLTPCVYPMIPITISIFGAKKGGSRARSFVLATFYVGGIALMFGTLGTVFALLGKQFGTFLANPWVIVPIALLFAALAASMFGAFELALPQSAQERLSRVGGKGFGGAFLMGLVGGVIAAPCTGPPLAGILTYVATTRNAVYGFTLLATYAIGIGIPFWLIAGFSMSLPRSGRWMEHVKSVFGIALLVASLYYLKNVVTPLRQLTGTTTTFLGTMIGLVVVGLAAGAVHLTFHDAAAKRARKAVAVAATVIGFFGITNYVVTPKGPIHLTWMTDEAAALADARSHDRPVLIDFMADWCLPCKELELNVFSKPDVGAEMRDRFTLLRVDCSNDDDPVIGAIKKKYGADTLPAIRIASPQGKLVAQPEGDAGKLTPPQFLEFLQAHH